MVEPPAAPVASAMAAALRTLGMHPLAGAAEEVGPFLCIDAGLGVSRANVALPLGAPRRPAAELGAVADWFALRGLNFRLDLPADAPSPLFAAATVLGLQFWGRQPLMLLESISPSRAPGTLAIERVADDAGIADFCSLDAPGPGEADAAPDIVAASVNNPALRILLGRLEGRPAARIVAMLHGDLATLHSLYVHPDLRRHGFGTEMTLAALALARQGGARSAALASTAEARALYERLGFRTVGETVSLGTEVPIFPA
ncbi:GNAT family N-acetyltransferase [Tepidiforma sp.]|uniref:GNAT family N-acetyltransferase n=1 Tax=Tepidiforma sp. TaxID=2682230 RepID=UPI002ADDA027|nr:GNAT family N-acetyltransferase [Tepidiforma sp.]